MLGRGTAREREREEGSKDKVSSCLNEKGVKKRGRERKKRKEKGERKEERERVGGKG